MSNYPLLWLPICLVIKEKQKFCSSNKMYCFLFISLLAYYTIKIQNLHCRHWKGLCVALSDMHS